MSRRRSEHRFGSEHRKRATVQSAFFSCCAKRGNTEKNRDRRDYRDHRDRGDRNSYRKQAFSRDLRLIPAFGLVLALSLLLFSLIRDRSLPGARKGGGSAAVRAELLAKQYDYDGALAVLQAEPGFSESSSMRRLAERIQREKESCVPYPPDQVPHIFFHTLIVDTDLAFDGDSKQDGYNQVMTTIPECRSILEELYQRGYVLVSLHDLCEPAQDGTVRLKELLLPEGKTPIVLSQDDVSYYHYMEGDGFARKLFVNSDGKVKNLYLDAKGQTLTGDYDLVPLLDSFVEKHPDFSYHGHKGILALTGYEGVLGYRTDEVYLTREQDRVTAYQQQFFDTHPDFDWQKELEEASQTASAMRENGWEFASHTWGHINPERAGLEGLRRDTQRWKTYVAPIVGETDVMIFAFGADIGGYMPYTHDNELFNELKSQGFSIFCGVDASVPYWVQVGSDFFRQARRNLDGYRMYYNPELVSDLFDARSVFDKSRPLPVPEM